MTRVELACRWILLHLLLEQLQRGPNFTRLPPAHFYHGHVNEVGQRLRVGTRAPNVQLGEKRFTVSRRRWMLDQPPEPPIQQPVPLRMPAKAYVYCDHGAPLRRTAEALKILTHIEKSGGDYCATERRVGRKMEPGHANCFCLEHENHNGPHRCEHGYW